MKRIQEKVKDLIEVRSYKICRILSPIRRKRFRFIILPMLLRI